METFQQYYVEGQEVYIDEIYYYYVNPEERLRLSNMLRAELELPEITLDEIPTSTNEPDYDTQPYQSDSSNSETSDDTSTYDQSGVYTPNYSDPYSYEEDTYTDETYYEEPVYDETPVYDSSY